MSKITVIFLSAIIVAGCNHAYAAQVAVTGNSRADNTLVQDTLRTANPTLAHILLDGNGVKINKINCSSLEYKQVDTKVISQPETGNWQELWTFHICERKVSLPISFIKNPKGSGYFMAIDMQHYKIVPDDSKYTE